MLFEAGNALFRGLDALGAFEREGAGDHADGERADFLGDLRDDGGCAGAGAAAHAGGDEDHVTALERFVQLLRGFFGGLASHFRVAASAETAGGLVADAHLAWARWRGGGPGRQCSQ